MSLGSGRHVTLPSRQEKNEQIMRYSKRDLTRQVSFPVITAHHVYLRYICGESAVLYGIFCVNQVKYKNALNCSDDIVKKKTDRGQSLAFIELFDRGTARQGYMMSQDHRKGRLCRLGVVDMLRSLHDKKRMNK